MSLQLIECKDRQTWNEFVARSPQGCVFCQTPFLDAAGVPYKSLFVETEGSPQLGILLFFPDGRPAVNPNPFSMYQGVLLARHLEELPPHRKSPQLLKLLDFILQQVEARYDRFCVSLHHSFPDLRSFSWFHYHQRNLGICQIDLRYTGIMDLATFRDIETYLATIRTTRRQEYRKALSSGWRLDSSEDINLLEGLYLATFDRQELTVPEYEVQMIASIARSAVADGYGQTMVCRNKSGEVAGATLFLYDATSGYYLIGANDPEYRKDGCGTLAVIENIRQCKERGLHFVDFVGVNSPNRGDYKTSLNAVPTPYYIVTWISPLADADIGVTTSTTSVGG